jgi:hypothetical protein
MDLGTVDRSSLGTIGPVLRKNILIYLDVIISVQVGSIPKRPYNCPSSIPTSTIQTVHHQDKLIHFSHIHPSRTSRGTNFGTRLCTKMLWSLEC